MWKNSSVCCLLALAILCLRSLTYSKEIGSLEHPQNLKCVTHNLRKMICTWDVLSEGRHGQTDFCYTTNDLSSSVCFETKEKRVEIPVPDSSSTVTVTTNSSSGISFATKEFEIHKKDILFVPLTPRILSLTPDFSTSTLNLKWSDNGLIFPYGLDAFWQIQILRKEATEKVTQVTYYSKLTHEDVILSWNWTSDMPLECTSHYVKIRCYINVTQFAGPKDWSEWSPVGEVPGKDTEPNGSGVFPQDIVVAVGSDLTICCVHEEGQQIKQMTYGPEIYPMIPLSSRSSAIRVLNASASDASGTNAVCTLSEDGTDGAVLFVGYAPDIPENLSCETSNFLIIKCTWKPGRPSGLYGKRRTKYSLFERISGKNVSCKVNEMNRERVCGFPVLADQKTYDFILGVSNPIGQTESSLLVDLTQRVHPKTPEKLTVSGNSSTSVHLHWFVNGSFAEIRLLCQIEISAGRSERKLHNVSMPGGKFSTHTAELNSLRPYTKYQFRVRCSAADHFWKWSDWSRVEEHTTLEAPPTRGPDIWRERSPSGKSLKVFWKPLSLSEANGKIVSHEVSCYLLEPPLEHKEVIEPSNSTEIKLGKNDCIISVVAKNHAGSSPPSRITSVELPSDNVKTDRAMAMGNGIYISWNSYPNMTCGYIVKWCHSSGSEPCTVDWQKFPSNTTDAVIKSGKSEHGCGNFVRVIQSYNRTHLYVCGSGAFSPVCVYVNRGRRSEEQVFKIDSKCESGKGRCSFNPNVNTVSVMINEELFSGMYIDFMGTDAAIFRSLTRRNAVRTDQHNSKWLSEPIFVDAHIIPDGTDPNDAKIYFFFKEKLTDNSGSTKQIHSMIARICPNDTGGQRSLVNKWTTFLKARLVCSVMDEDGTETYFDELEDVFLLETDNPRTTLVYGIFTTSSSIFKGSAVCVYHLSDIQTVFNGPFAHKEGPNHQLIPYQGRIPYPRPGTCPGGAFTPNMRTTKEFPDDVVTFIRNHPLMFNPIYPIHKRPLIIRIGADYKYTKIAVDRVNAADGRYHVLFLGTDQGTIQKVVVLPTNFSASGELILEELEVFQSNSPITTMKISSKKQQLYVSSDEGVTQVSLHRCHIYGTACADCCLARDPYCAWDGNSCSRFYPTGKRRSRRQDVRHGNPLTQCRGFNLKAYRNAAEIVQYGVKNNTTFLECTPKSPQASIKWLLQKDNDRRKEVKLNERIIATEQGLLIRSVQDSDRGLYHCIATENSFKQTLAKINFKVLDSEMVAIMTDKWSPWTWASSVRALQFHPKDFVGAFSHSEMQMINQYCKDSRQQGQQREEPQKMRGDYSKLKALINSRKSRNRRNQLPGS